MDNRDDKIMLMLGELKGEMTAGFSGINQRLDTVNGRLNKNDIRIGSLESSRSEAKGGVKVLSVIWNAVIAIVASLVTIFFTRK